MTVLGIILTIIISVFAVIGIRVVVASLSIKENKGSERD